MMGREVMVAIPDSELDFGPCEPILYGELDDTRPKRVPIKITGE